MTRRVLHTLFVAATVLSLTTTACDKGDGDKKADDKKADDEKADDDKADDDKAEAAADAGAEAAAEAGADAGAEAAAEGETGEAAAEGETGEAAEAGADAGAEGETGEAAEDDDDDGGDEKPEPKSDGGSDKTASAPKIDGKPIYEKKCKSCHGLDGKGDTTIGKKVDIPSLSKTKLGKGKIVTLITDGVADTKMKAFKEKLSKDEIDAVAAYVKKL